MSLATRVIGTILFDGGLGQVVHRERFKTIEYRDSPASLMQVYLDKAGGFDEILLLDVTASPQKRGPDLDLIRRLTDTAFLPVAYGGGIGSVEQAAAVIREGGAEKVVLHRRLDLITRMSAELGRQAVIASVEVGDIELWPGAHIALARRCDRWGGGEILLQSIERDGLLAGYDLDPLREVCAAVSIPVIASSGCGAPDDMLAAMGAGASAVAAGWMWDATAVVPLDCKRALAAAGHVVRIAK